MTGLRAWNGYNGLSRRNYRHQAINLPAAGDPPHVAMPGIHKVAALLRRWLLGTHQGSVTAAHWNAYLDEFAFRFNRGKSRRLGKCRGLETDTLPAIADPTCP
jgi:hypothetical protein